MLENVGGSELTAALLGAVVGGVVSGAVTLWQAKRERRMQRIAGGITAYKVMLEKRDKAIDAINAALGVARSFNAAPGELAKTGYPVYVASLRAVDDAHDRVSGAMLDILVSDSPNLRTRHAHRLLKTLGEIRDHLHGGTNTPPLSELLNDEDQAVRGVAEGAERLHALLPRLPDTDGSGDVWLQSFWGRPRNSLFRFFYWR
jgi:hypothetical protein